MAIGKLKTEQDLKRFIEEQFEGMPLNHVQGLAGELAERTRSRSGEEEVEVEGAAGEVVKVEHDLGEVPQHVGFTVRREAEGTNTWTVRLISKSKTEIEFQVNVGIPLAEPLIVFVEWEVSGSNGVSA